jgi:hypothetical protein
VRRPRALAVNPIRGEAHRHRAPKPHVGRRAAWPLNLTHHRTDSGDPRACRAERGAFMREGAARREPLEGLNTGRRQGGLWPSRREPLWVGSGPTSAKPRTRSPLAKLHAHRARNPDRYTGVCLHAHGGPGPTLCRVHRRATRRLGGPGPTLCDGRRAWRGHTRAASSHPEPQRQERKPGAIGWALAHHELNPASAIATPAPVIAGDVLRAPVLIPERDTPTRDPTHWWAGAHPL